MIAAYTLYEVALIVLLAVVLALCVYEFVTDFRSHRFRQPPPWAELDSSGRRSPADALSEGEEPPEDSPAVRKRSQRFTGGSE